MSRFPAPGFLGLPSSTPGLSVPAVGGFDPPSIVQNPGIEIVAVNQFDGQSHLIQGVLNATITYGYDIGTATATIDVTEIPSFLSGSPISGTSTKTSGSATLIGSGTSYTTQLTPGASISVPGGGLTEVETVLSISSNTSLTVTQPFVASAAGASISIRTTLSNYSQITIYTDAGGRSWPPGTPVRNGHPMRFNGLYLRTEATLWPHVYTLVCRGTLYRAEQFHQSAFIGIAPFITQALQSVPIGQLFSDILGGRSSTDQNIVTAILQQVPGLVVDPADIGGTGRQFGTVNLRQQSWPPYMSATDMIQQFDQVCLGYRTYETIAGRIVRTQIFGYPGTSGTQFTEGEDIWEGRGTRSVEQLINASFVEGGPLPNDTQGLIFAFIQQQNPFQPASQPVVEQFSSQWIEGQPLDSFDANSTTGLINGPPTDPTSPLNPVDVANWRLFERNREVVNVQFTTFRDDILFPGHTILVNTPHMAVTEPIWLQHVEVRITAEPVMFSQTLYGIGGGVPTGFTGPNPPTSIDTILF